MAEKRKYMRFNVLLNAICRKSGKSKSLEINNFSKEGIGVISNNAFSKGEDLEIEMTIPGDNIPVLFEGKVAWVNGQAGDNKQYKSGIRFEKINNQDRSRILEYIYQRWIMPDRSEVKQDKMEEKWG
ncbi:MAG: PilZ domain-containing protein [Candidatus Omnitrophota bacterium]|nr:PilZ domain-containing protein [Candidatus Omnitrophota bacterium]